MPKRQPRVARPPVRSLATKIILFVSVCSFATALVVSSIAIQSSYGHLKRALERNLPALLTEVALELTPLLPAPGAPLEPGGVPALAELLERERPREGRLLLLDSLDRVVAASGAPAELPALRGELRDREGGVLDYTDPAGVRVVGSSLRFGDGAWRLLVELPFDEAFAPVRTVITRVFAVDLCIILLVSLLAYRLTTRAVRPIEILSDAARRIGQGQWDHEIPEPSSHDEIGLLARTFNDMMRRLRGYQIEIETANRNLKERNSELQQAKEMFEQLSITDGLTKLHNHRFFQDHLTREIKRVTRSGEELTMLLIDIDDFKSLNDRFGHAAGDELLVGLARIMNETVRESDLLARYGGEEFVILASNTDLRGGYRLAEKIRMAVAENSFILDDSLRPTRTTVSIGVACYRGNRKSFFQAADRALYRAKAEGKNCVIMDGDEALA